MRTIDVEEGAAPSARMFIDREDEAGAVCPVTPDDIGYHLCSMLVHDMLAEEQQKKMSQSPGFRPSSSTPSPSTLSPSTLSPSTPTLKSYAIRFSNATRVVKTIGVTVCPFREYSVVRRTMMQTTQGRIVAPVQPVRLNEVQEKVTFKEPVVLTDAETGCSHVVNNWAGEDVVALKKFFAETDESQIDAVIGRIIGPPQS